MRTRDDRRSLFQAPVVFLSPLRSHHQIQPRRQVPGLRTSTLCQKARKAPLKYWCALFALPSSLAPPFDHRSKTRARRICRLIGGDSAAGIMRLQASRPASKLKIGKHCRLLSPTLFFSTVCSRKGGLTDHYNTQNCVGGPPPTSEPLECLQWILQRRAEQVKTES